MLNPSVLPFYTVGIIASEELCDFLSNQFCSHCAATKFQQVSFISSPRFRTSDVAELHRVQIRNMCAQVAQSSGLQSPDLVAILCILTPPCAEKASLIYASYKWYRTATRGWNWRQGSMLHPSHSLFPLTAPSFLSYTSSSEDEPHQNSSYCLFSTRESMFCRSDSFLSWLYPLLNQIVLSL